MKTVKQEKEIYAHILFLDLFIVKMMSCENGILTEK
jgi:hypothetical protein